jgi:uncharacterized membrane protein (DUF106 family)
MNNDKIQSNKNRLWKEYFKTVEAMRKIQPEIEKINEKSEFAQNVKDEEKMREIQTEINDMRQRIFGIQLTHSRVFNILVMSSLNQIPFN